MKALVLCIVISVYYILQIGGVAALLIPSVLILLVLFLLRFDNEMADKYPRWLGGVSYDYAPPDLFNQDTHAIVQESRQKIKKIDEDAV